MSDRGVFLDLLKDVSEVTLLELKLTDLGPACAHFGERSTKGLQADKAV